MQLKTLFPVNKHRICCNSVYPISTEKPFGSQQEMSNMWISLKENMKFGCKMTEIAWPSPKMARHRICSSTSVEREVTNEPEENPFSRAEFRHSCIRDRFLELQTGDPSRNIIEMIFRASTAKPGKSSRKIKRVMKVKNPLETLEKFEKYREAVKKRSFGQHKKNPRSIVDGNELLQFYGTTMNCCGKKTLQVSELCGDPTCRVCRIIQSGFNTSYNRKNGIRLSTNSDELSEEIRDIAKSKNAKKAVIVCRTIAGRIVDMKCGECEEEYDSVGNGLYTKSEFLILRNSTAVLPCFIIVFE